MQHKRLDDTIRFVSRHWVGFVLSSAIVSFVACGGNSTPSTPGKSPETASTRTTSDSTTPAVQNVSGNSKVKSFNRAKRLLPDIFTGHEETFYCGCTYDKKVVDLASCNYQVKKDAKRAKRLEWEHVVPAHAFGQSFAAWREGHSECVDSKGRAFKGRKCAGKMEEQFRFMEADLYNLRPAIGEVNGRRSNFRMAMIPGEKREFGACDVEIEDRKVEPKPDIRGDIARTYFYMNAAYPDRGVIGSASQKLFETWAKEDPIDDAERAWAKRVEAIQGNVNPFVQ